MTWDDYFLGLATQAASKSKDRSTRVGCVIVDRHHNVRATGYNGFPRGADDTRENWHQRPLKTLVTEHAERNAIYCAARAGTALDGCTAYVAWMPCADCARGLIQSGIVEVVLDPAYVVSDDLAERWREHHEAARALFDDCGVRVRYAAR